MTKIEEVARALYESECQMRCSEPDWGRGGYKTQVLVYQAMARAAIEVLRKPSNKEMQIALNVVQLYAANGLDYELLKGHELWRAMIDAVLEE